MFCLFHLCEQTNRQTDKQTDKPTYPKFIWCSENKPLRPAMPGLAANIRESNGPQAVRLRTYSEGYKSSLVLGRISAGGGLCGILAKNFDFYQALIFSMRIYLEKLM